MNQQKHESFDKIVNRMWAAGAGHQVNEVFAAGVTVMVNAAAQMDQTMRNEAAMRLRDVANRIQNGQAFEKPSTESKS